MVIQVLASITDDVGYYYNLGYLQRALQNNQAHLNGGVNNHAPMFVFNDTARIYDFTRSAKFRIREDMAAFLLQPNVLPGLQAQDQQAIQEPFDRLFNHLDCKRSLSQVNQQQVESMKMLIFNDANGVQAEQYVAHVTFTCYSHRDVQQQLFTVNASLTCQRLHIFRYKGTTSKPFFRLCKTYMPNE